MEKIVIFNFNSIFDCGCIGDVLTHYDCIQCGRCVNKCPKKSIGYTK
ncbi:4Fe-4S binding protein [Romboutsia sedimentorum]|uniref:4Fe-4S binding protein n=1 Tax=Romboutsia sedimentorum TaxID=1368474 RepID=A0ABT7EAH9_9FIRM|nr:4Fe-4S binding protein [Romboutsia sedimentorum]MDK2563692.1 4Fe-4S binding protein [Romboutsia sedimentorum]